MLERHPEVKAMVKGIVFIDSYHECSMKYFEEAGIAEVAVKGVEKKHKTLEKMTCCVNCCWSMGCCGICCGGKKKSAKTDFKDALLWVVLTRSKTGWNGCMAMYSNSKLERFLTSNLSYF